MFGEIPQEPRPGRMKRIIQFPVTKIILGIVFVFGSIIVGNVGIELTRKLFSDAEKPSHPWLVLMFAVMTILCILGYYAYVHLIERRRLTELSRAGALKELGMGCSIGFGLMTSIIFILWILGYYEVIAVSSAMILLVPLFEGIFTGFFEEILFRGVIFRIINENLGSWLAILISALIFGFAHSLNPNASPYSGLSISLGAGIILAAVYLITHRLWIAIGVHFAWNFTLGGIFGVTVSGQETKGFLQAEISGPEILTGGAFGLESSILGVVIPLSAGAYFIYKARVKGHFTQPFWRRPQKTEPEVES